ncbi:MAG: hypothetical protein AB1725_09905 [Armatimonadota bacterium]
MKTWLNAVLAACASLVAGTAAPQSFNVDLDGLFFPGPPSPTGVPRPSFGAAAEQPGLWNQVYILARGPIPLQDISGRWTGATYTAWGGVGTGGGWANPRWSLGEVNDDFWLLMGDAANIGPPFAPHQIMPPPSLTVYTFDGLRPGLYEIYTYAVRPIPRHVPVAVTVPDAETENPQLSTGPLPSDWQFRRGITHTVHRAVVAGRLEIRTTGEFPYAYVNGFQIVKVK